MNLIQKTYISVYYGKMNKYQTGRWCPSRWKIEKVMSNLIKYMRLPQSFEGRYPSYRWKYSL